MKRIKTPWGYEVEGIGSQMGNAPKRLLMHDWFETPLTRTEAIDEAVRRWGDDAVLDVRHTGRAWVVYVDESEMEAA